MAIAGQARTSAQPTWLSPDFSQTTNAHHILDPLRYSLSLRTLLLISEVLLVEILGRQFHALAAPYPSERHPMS